MNLGNKLNLIYEYNMKISHHTDYSTFCSDDKTGEYTLILESDESDSFNDSIESITKKYRATLESLNLNENTQVFSRVYLSDIINQKEDFYISELAKYLFKGAVSLIQQRQLSKRQISIFSYHIKSDIELKKSININDQTFPSNTVAINGKSYTMLWNANFLGEGCFDSYNQSQGVLQKLNTSINNHKMTFLNNAVRTWIYVRDIDNHYQGLVKKRKEFFEDKGLTHQTRYLASTGIEGKGCEQGTLVIIDALSFSNIKADQIIQMEAPMHMSPTIKYGVTFERGLRLRFGDRSHLFISGTASIDNNGKVLYVGDTKKQTQRAVENISALLGGQGATLNDIMYLFVYMRDPNNIDIVRNTLKQLIPQNIPILFLEGAVCRPTWLVEIEGFAIIPDNTDYPDFL